MKNLAILFIFLFSFNIIIGQVQSVEELDSKFLNWHNKDYASTGVLGTSVDRAKELIKSNPKTEKKIIVAVIDSGVDIDHEDLKDNIWVNENEVPDNGIDDDGNGYIDDMHGWNFIGNSNGENIYYENLEYTRIVRENDPQNPDLADAKKRYNAELEERKEEKKILERFETVYNKAKSIIEDNVGVTVNSAKDLSAVNSTDPLVLGAIRFLQQRYSSGFTEEGWNEFVVRNDEYLKYRLNLDYEPRSITGDDPTDITDKFYGNPDVKGPRPNHGTSVSGVIGATVDNGVGINGIATNVQIMCLRSTPNGDERDKDVALSIYYAVDNGADIINMSFGKPFSPQKKFVDDAVKYAEQKGVLLIHGSGNASKDIDIYEVFPSDRFLDRSEATNWLNVGATSMDLGKEVVATFSNYGQKHVDIFAPGVDILSTDTSNTYSLSDGTSLSAPVVTGIAALVLSYYPDIEPAELIDILLVSSLTFTKPKKVFQPSNTGKKRPKSKFVELSKSGGIVNAYGALIEAQRRYD